MGDNLVTVKHYLQPHEAHLAQGVLEGEGIEVVLQDEHLSQLYGSALGGVRLQVAEKDLTRAIEILDGLALPSDRDVV